MIRYVYVAGPYSGDEEANTDRALAAGEEILAAGYYPYVPHLSHFWHQRYPHTYEQWMEIDMAWLARCDALVRLPGESPGAEREVAFARSAAIPVFFGMDQFRREATTWRNR